MNTIQSYKKIIAATGIVLALVIYGYFIWIPPASPQLEIAMLNIGQGDSFYIRTPKGKDIIIDGGRDRTVISELGSVMPPYDHTLELVIATHPDADHIAGLTELPTAFTIKRLITNGLNKEKGTGFSDALENWDEQGVEVIHATRGWNLEIEQDVWMEFLHPDPAYIHTDINDDSVVFILHYKNFSGLFTGDMSQEVEKELLQQYSSETLNIDLLKVSHHGSKTSSSSDFLFATSPSIALISVGQDNDYGHPNAIVLDRLNKASIPFLRTDLSGRVVCTTPGEGIECVPQSIAPPISHPKWQTKNPIFVLLQKMGFR